MSDVPGQCQSHDDCHRKPYALLSYPTLNHEDGTKTALWYCLPCYRAVRRGSELHPNDLLTEGYS